MAPVTADAEAVTRLGPYAIAGAVGAALARLGDGPVRLAHAVAVLERAPLVTAARLADVGSEQASAFSEQLVRAGILRDLRPLEFAHALVRDAVLSGLTAGERARLHAEAARILGEAGGAPEAIAIHLLHAEPRGDEEVASVLAEAGRRALASGALTEAVGVDGAGRRRAASRGGALGDCCSISGALSTGWAARRRSIACWRRTTRRWTRSIAPRRRSD